MGQGATADLQDRRNTLNPIDCDIFVCTHIHHKKQCTCILILMFCTSLWQFKVNVGCICLTPVSRKLLFFKKMLILEFLGITQGQCSL